MRWKDAGVSKSTGKPFRGFWSCPTRMPDGSWCKFKPQEGTPEGNQPRKPGEDLQQNMGAKDEVITRSAIAKSIIENGGKFHDSQGEAELWISWIYGKQPQVQGISDMEVPF